MILPKLPNTKTRSRQYVIFESNVRSAKTLTEEETMPKETMAVRNVKMPKISSAFSLTLVKKVIKRQTTNRISEMLVKIKVVIICYFGL